MVKIIASEREKTGVNSNDKNMVYTSIKINMHIVLQQEKAVKTKGGNGMQFSFLSTFQPPSSQQRFPVDPKAMLSCNRVHTCLRG